MSTKSLKAADREFFGHVRRAAYANPFGEERRQLDGFLGGGVGASGATETVDRAIETVRRRLEALWPLDLNDYGAEERDLLESAVLFDVFHLFTEDYDLLVEKQRKAGAQPVQSNFGKEIVAKLVKYGLSIERSVRYVGIFFQMRRAFYFAHRDLKGTSPSMQRLRERLWDNVFTHDIALYERHLWDRMEDFSTFIVGETGSGKGAAAAVLGYSSWIPYDEQAGRFAQSFTELFVPINLSQYTESLIESELFGHKKGAFTGAIDSHPGVLGRCRRHGVIFLDEIGEVSIPVQIKLLRVLQERLYTPVGSHETERFEGRVLAATHRPLDELRAQGRFRNDFYYRLCSDVIEMPTLRQRIDEDPRELKALVEHIVEGIIGAPVDSLVRQVLRTIRQDLPDDYAWPGNVRELEQCVRRVILRRDYRGDTFATMTIPVEVGTGDMAALFEAMDRGELEARELLGRYCRVLYERHGTYEEVARRTGLDRRTAKKHVDEASEL
jgi:DNA-binding NtrC family response regulator